MFQTAKRIKRLEAAILDMQAEIEVIAGAPTFVVRKMLDDLLADGAITAIEERTIWGRFCTGLRCAYTANPYLSGRVTKAALDAERLGVPQLSLSSSR